MTDALAEEFRAIDLPYQVAQLPARTRLISSAPLDSHNTLRMELDRLGRADIATERIDSLLAWRQYRDLGAGAVPTKVLDAIVQWLR